MHTVKSLSAETSLLPVLLILRRESVIRCLHFDHHQQRQVSHGHGDCLVVVLMLSYLPCETDTPFIFLLTNRLSCILCCFLSSHINFFRMKFTIATASILATVASAASPFAPAKSKNTGKSAYVSKLVSNAKVIRKLDQNQQEEEEYMPDISGYSLKFIKCQFVKAYDDELAEDEDSETVLATKRFVVFRLCPDASCSSCNYNYGEYMIDLESYLQATVEYQQQAQEEMCNACQECGNWNDQDANGQNQDNQNRFLQDNYYYNVDCDSCYDECMKIENMEDNGYVDATEFLDCQMIYDPEDDSHDALYAGPMCASLGSKIKIGVFLDEECNILDSSKDVDDYLMDNDGYQMKLSHALLKTVYSEDTCVSCLMPAEEDENQDNNNDNNNNNQEEEPEILEMCQNLYEAAAKCEQAHGFDDGHVNYYGYEVQASQEGVVCDFIDSLLAGSYDEQGEIVVNGASSAGGNSQTTGGQKFALTFFILGTAALAVYSAMLHSKLTKGSTGGLADQGGAMA